MLYLIDKYVVKVDIHLPPGVFVFANTSGVGKTYLASLLKTYMTYGEPVTSYTYADFVSGTDLTSVIQSGKYKVLLIDRYDLYYGEALEALRNPPKDMIILIDTKRDDFIMRPYSMCAIGMDEGLVLVA